MKKYLYILLMIFISLDVLLVFKVNRKNIFLKQCKSIEENSTLSLNKIIESQILQFKYNGKRLKSDDSRTLDTLQTIIKDDPKFILSINENACETCVDFALADLANIEQKIGTNHIIILTKFSNEREAVYLSKRLGDKFQILNSTSRGNLFSDDLMSISPIFFILNKDLISNYIFVYSPNFPKLNESFKLFVTDYFHTILTSKKE